MNERTWRWRRVWPTGAWHRQPTSSICRARCLTPIWHTSVEWTRLRRLIIASLPYLSTTVQRYFCFGAISSTLSIRLAATSKISPVRWSVLTRRDWKPVKTKRMLWTSTVGVRASDDSSAKSFWSTRPAWMVSSRTDRTAGVMTLEHSTTSLVYISCTSEATTSVLKIILLLCSPLTH